MYTGSNLTLEVKDMKRTVDFYTRCLDFTKRPHPNPQWAELVGPGIVIGVTQVDKPSKEANGPMLGLHVESLKEAGSSLKDRGVVFEGGEIQDGPVKLRFFSDPDGNRVYICESKIEHTK